MKYSEKLIIENLMQQAQPQKRHMTWDDVLLVTECRRYAVSIGCDVGDGACYDEITCHTEEQWDAMRKWWEGHA
jgi:hypothetical protein